MLQSLGHPGLATSESTLLAVNPKAACQPLHCSLLHNAVRHSLFGWCAEASYLPEHCGQALWTSRCDTVTDACHPTIPVDWTLLAVRCDAVTNACHPTYPSTGLCWLSRMGACSCRSPRRCLQHGGNLWVLVDRVVGIQPACTGPLQYQASASWSHL